MGSPGSPQPTAAGVARTANLIFARISQVEVFIGAPDFTPFVATVLEAPFEEHTD